MYKQTQNIFNYKSLPAFSFNEKMRLNEYDLNGIILDVSKLVPEFLNSSVHFQKDIIPTELKIMADPLKIREAFLKLIENANDAMPSGGTLTVSSKKVSFVNTFSEFVNNCETGTCALLLIADNGTGMDESIIGRIQEPFFTTKDGAGKGLGFSIALRIIKDHGGSIGVDSTKGAGTTISVYLPLLKPSTDRIIPIPLPPSFHYNRRML